MIVVTTPLTLVFRTFETDLKQKKPERGSLFEPVLDPLRNQLSFFDALTGFPTVCSVHGVSPLIGRQWRRVLAVLLVLALDQAQLAP